MTTTMNPPITWSSTEVADSVYFDTGEPSHGVDDEGLMPTSHFLGVLAVPSAAVILPLLAAWQNVVSWWVGIPIAVIAPFVLGVAVVIGYDRWMTHGGGATSALPPVDTARPSSRTPQFTWRNDLEGSDSRRDMQRHLLERANQPLVRSLKALSRYHGEQWWQRKAFTAHQLRDLDPREWRSYAKLQEHDHVVSGPAGIFSIHDLHTDNITINPSQRPQLDVLATFDSHTAPISLLTVEVTSPSWMRIAPVTETHSTCELNALPHSTSTCTLTTTHDNRDVNLNAVIPASALETGLLEDIVAAGVGPDEFHLVFVAHGATMSNPAEYVELRYADDEEPIGGAWLVHPNHLTAFLTSRPVLITDETALTHGHRLAAES